jgi:hypothetical protein
MSFVVSHIYREDDQIEDTLANLGFSLQSPMSDIVFPIQVKCVFSWEPLGVPNFRFST